MNTKSVLENYNLFLEFEKQAKLFPKKLLYKIVVMGLQMKS